MKTTSKEWLKPFNQSTHKKNIQTRRHLKTQSSQMHRHAYPYNHPSHTARDTFIQDCGVCHTQLQLRGMKRSLFPNVTDFIVSGHRQTCSFSRGPSQHFTWLDSIWRERRRALITVQRHCKVCMSVCVSVCVHFKNSFCSYSTTFLNKQGPYRR